ncbi:MAG: PLP-dependent aminotransferase family protein [Firmicutes bacterium]|nr:PLP-dependent aminotransferase family protein [Bacillota bacterium]
MFTDFKYAPDRPAFLQLKEYLKEQILGGIIQAGERLPSTRELASTLRLGRNTVIQAYQDLEEEGFIETVPGQGSFVRTVAVEAGTAIRLPWDRLTTSFAANAVRLDIEKSELKWERGMISFKSIAPDGKLFPTEEFKRAFLHRFALEGEKLLNYGYAQGYRPLLEYLATYLKQKGVDPECKAILVTNGFTEGLNLVLAGICTPGDGIVTENPTHNTALKIFKLRKLKVYGIPMTVDGIDVASLVQTIAVQPVKAGFLIPSYHNPTGLVMPPAKRQAVLEVFARYRVPIIEDGFNEELRYSGAHVAPLLALAGKGNNVIYIGSFSKILFPGLRLGWVVADRELIATLESIKRSMNIHTSFLDQALLYEYLQNGSFEKYLRRARKVYRQRHEAAIQLASALIPHRQIWGEGGLHIFVELAPQINARAVLAACYRRGVLFMPGDLFYTDGGGGNTLRLGIGRVTEEEMAQGFKIIGEEVSKLEGEKSASV